MIKKNSNTPKSRFRSKRDNKGKKIVTYIRLTTHMVILLELEQILRLFGLKKL